MKIGWTNLGYPIERTILNKVPNVEYVRSRSYGAAVTRLLLAARVPQKGRLKFGCSYLGGTADCRVDLLHFFNLLCCGLCKKPYVTTFETSVPRGLNSDDYWFRRGIESMMSDRCRKLLALSECAKRIQVESMKPFLSGSDLTALEKKIMVLPPPQKILFDRGDPKVEGNSRCLKAFFVGCDFFRKGGGEILRAFTRLRKDFPVELWLIGDLSRRGYACGSEQDDTATCSRMIEENRGWIHWFPSLPNKKVLKLMRTCDIGLLPTRADTYGYSVLEMQACGLPVVTTDVRALSEINDDACGWVIDGCGKRDGSRAFGEADYSTPEKLRALSERIENGLEDLVSRICVDPSVIAVKSSRAVDRVCRMHDPIRYGEQLQKVYEEALG